jgi:putative phage-type endonuclease
MNRQAWLEERRLGIGGSDIAAIMGLSEYKTAYEVWLEKTGRVEAASDDAELCPGGKKEAAYWGTEIEELLLKAFNEAHGVEVIKPEQPFIKGIFRANVDGIGDGFGWEAKTTYRGNPNWGDDFIPKEYFAQVQHYMYTTGVDKWYVSCLFGGQMYKEWGIYADSAYIADMVEKATTFWEHVKNDTEPPIPDEQWTPRITTMKWPVDNGETVELGLSVDEVLYDYMAAKADESAAKERADRLKAKVQRAMGEATHGISEVYRVTWKCDKNGNRRFNVREIEK